MSRTTRERVESAVYRAIDAVNRLQPPDAQYAKSADARLFGTGFGLDSIELVTFAMELEEQIRQEFGVSLIVADERAVSMKRSPFATVGTVVDFIVERLAEEGPAAQEGHG
jgi:D-alanine--poly(phosphoribitol) ligase subunit 2